MTGPRQGIELRLHFLAAEPLAVGARAAPEAAVEAVVGATIGKVEGNKEEAVPAERLPGRARGRPQNRRASLRVFHGEKIGRLRNGQPAQSARPFQNFLKPGAIRSGSPGEAFDRGRVEIECMTVCSQYASKKQNAAPDGAAPIRCS